MRTKKSLIIIGLLTATLSLPLGCRKPEVLVYDTPKETNAPTRQLAQTDPASAANPFSWQPAEQWQELPPTQFRKGNYLFTDDNGSAEITVTSFPGSTGGLLANVNRWLRQASLPSISEEELALLVTETEIAPALTASFVDLKAQDPTPDSTRIYTAVLPYQGESWFFKLSGPYATVETQIPALETMVETLSFGQMAAAPAAEHNHEGDLAFKTPEGWSTSQGSSMRLASFAIEKEGLPTADFSIIAFPGDTGGVKDNVNRWRRQIGLGEWTSEQTDAAAVTLENEAGYDFLVFDLKSETDEEKAQNTERILAAILEYSGKSWFFKLRGDAFLIETQEKKFKDLLRSVHFDHSGHSH